MHKNIGSMNNRRRFGIGHSVETKTENKRLKLLRKISEKMIADQQENETFLGNTHIYFEIGSLVY